MVVFRQSLLQFYDGQKREAWNNGCNFFIAYLNALPPVASNACKSKTDLPALLHNRLSQLSSLTFGLEQAESSSRTVHPESAYPLKRPYDVSFEFGAKIGSLPYLCAARKPYARNGNGARLARGNSYEGRNRNVERNMKKN